MAGDFFGAYFRVFEDGELVLSFGQKIVCVCFQLLILLIEDRLPFAVLHERRIVANLRRQVLIVLLTRLLLNICHLLSLIFVN